MHRRKSVCPRQGLLRALGHESLAERIQCHCCRSYKTGSASYPQNHRRQKRCLECAASSPTIGDSQHIRPRNPATPLCCLQRPGAPFRRSVRDLPGNYRCDNRDDLISKLEAAAKYDRHIVVEENIDCIELETAVLGNDDVIVSRVGQIMPHGEFYTFESKYEDAESKTCIPALVDEKIQEKIREYAIKAFKAVDGHGLSRVDFFLDKKTNNIYLNEINTMPGFTKISMYPQLMNDFGISYSDLLDKLIELAMEK